MRFDRVIGVFVCALVASLALGVERSPAGPWLEGPRASARSVEVRPDETSAEAGRAAAFLARRDGTWTFRFDRRTGFATMVQGSGVPLIPGRGNALGAAALAGIARRDGDLEAAALEPLVRDFLAANRELVVPAAGTLELVREETSTRAGGRLHTLAFRWILEGVPVEDARVFVRINSGNVTQFGASLVGGPPPETTVPAIDPQRAVDAVLAWGGDDESARLQREPRLVLQPEEHGDSLGYRLVYVVEYDLGGGVLSREGRVDALSGAVIGFRDANRYGTVRGGVYERTVTDPEIDLPFVYADVVTDGGSVSTDVTGAFDYAGGRASAGLDGTYFDTVCNGGCTNPVQPNVAIELGAGVLEFGSGGSQAVGNGTSTRADRNAFYHLNRARRVARGWLPGETWFDSRVTVNVNVQATCNATWNGGANTANFYRAGGGCNNTGEIADVMYHEWGHGIDGNTNGGDGATGEATADQVSMHMTRSPLIGPWFRTTGAPVRNIDRFTTGKGLLTRSNIDSKCAAGPGPLGYSVHCEGELYGQSAWDLAQALVAKHGEHTGWRTSERLFFTSLYDADTYVPEAAQSVYDAYVNADDDDGNLANGTPNGQEIFDAFDRHEIAGAPVLSSPGCTRPAQPASNAVVSGCDRIDVTWAEVPGVDHYEILRGEVRLDAPFLTLAAVPAGQTAISDTAVAPGVDYHYVVMAIAPDGCESTVEAPTTVRLDDRPVLSATAVVVDDMPRGNRSGFADPDEEVDLVVTLRNSGAAGAASVAGTLVSDTAGVTILEGFDTWPALAPGASAVNEVALRFEADGSQLACGDTVRFRVVPTEDSGCASDDSYVSVVLGDRVAEYQDGFETGTGWALDVAGSSAASGNWTLGAPDGTDFQPAADVSADPGGLCWFTAPNPGGIGADDVDDGLTVLLSPPLDLSGLDAAVLGYWRWFANRDLGEDPGDFFAVDASDDGGASWVNLETLGTNETAPVWTRVEFDLTQFIALTDRVRLRFVAADGPATGNIIEAAIDEVRIDRPVCDDTPACFVEPTFAGAQAAAGGASCAETTVSWSAASSNCQNATISYSVHRSTDPGFEPSPATLRASGLTGTEFADSLLEPGAQYTYVVRAIDSRSGADSNVVRVSATAPSAPDVAAPLFAGLGAANAGVSCGETTLGWSAALETCSGPVVYDVFRSTDPSFVPGATSRVGATTSLTFTDAALMPGVDYTYVVRARDGAGNVDANDLRQTVSATIRDETVLELDFESNGGGFAVAQPNDAVTGTWELGDPEATGVQPGDDHSEPGVNAWVTGLAAAGGDGGNDVDDGTTTLVSGRTSLGTFVDPVVRYWRWFTNDGGQNPGEDPLSVDVSNDDGATWTLLERVDQSQLAWVESAIPLIGVVEPTDLMRFRFTAEDTGVGGSLVEAAIDDFALIDRDQGCLGCSTPVGTVGTIVLSPTGADVLLDWSADPAPGTRFAVYVLDGPGFADAVKIGTTDGRTFVHEDALLSGESYSYRVSAIDGCGNESALE